MAFSSTYNTEFYSNWNTSYLCSDSDDQFKPRTVVNIEDYIQPVYHRENETEISYTKGPETHPNSELNVTTPYMVTCVPEFNYNDQSPVNNDDYDAVMREEFGLDQERSPSKNEMELEGSDYQSNALTYDNEENSNFFISASPSEMPSGTYSSKNEYSAQMPQFSADFQRGSLRMRELIAKLLQGREINESDLLGLNQFERDILVFINQRKFKSEGGKSSRRREEKQKLFFKAALKFILNRFLTNMSKVDSVKKKDISSNIFYIAYFKDAARKKGLDISAFYPPNQKSNQQKNVKRELKSFNLKYIELLLSSGNFLKETLEFLENNFLQDYSKARYTKIDKILQHASDIYEQTHRMFVRSGNQNQESFREIVKKRLQELIVTNSKSKLPWSDAELNEARQFAKEAILKIHYKNNNAY